LETSMVSRSIISMSSKPLSARVLSSSHPMPPAPTMRTTDRDEGGAGRVSVAGWASDASKIRETRTFRILGELEIAHGRRHRGRQARASRARRALPNAITHPHSRNQKCAREHHKWDDSVFLHFGYWYRNRGHEKSVAPRVCLRASTRPMASPSGRTVSPKRACLSSARLHLRFPCHCTLAFV